jgi:hypothetical protein
MVLLVEAIVTETCESEDLQKTTVSTRRRKQKSPEMWYINFSEILYRHLYVSLSNA